ncbi:SDR family oxidoreductase [Paraburkholderia phymatum]|uniref:SDR family NAD(P)-dependent oxidoreductase n=1 Tax=Paraburkholderia phymatum TaxID=148447 RepID=UPI00316F8F33
MGGRLNNKRAIVTGASGGIGDAIVKVFLREGASVALFDISHERDSQQDKAISVQAGTARFYVVDVSNDAQVSRAVGQVERDIGPVDILVNNAAVTGSSSALHEISVDEYRHVFDVNVLGPLLCTKHVVSRMLATGRTGSIVNVASTYAVAGNGDIPLYHCTKASAAMLARCGGVSYAQHGIRFNSVLPGTTRTRMSVQAASLSEDGGRYLSDLVSAHPMKRQADPIEIANGVLFLASDEASYITGTELAIDGGYLAQ